MARFDEAVETRMAELASKVAPGEQIPLGDSIFGPLIFTDQKIVVDKGQGVLRPLIDEFADIEHLAKTALVAELQKVEEANTKGSNTMEGEETKVEEGAENTGSDTGAETTDTEKTEETAA